MGSSMGSKKESGGSSELPADQARIAEAIHIAENLPPAQIADKIVVVDRPSSSTERAVDAYYYRDGQLFAKAEHVDSAPKIKSVD